MICRAFRSNCQYLRGVNVAIQLDITALVPPLCVTRAKGESAYQELRASLGVDDVDVNLDCVEVLSMSFLDGIILSLINDDLRRKVTFKTEKKVTREKLARISEIRDVPIYCRSSGQAEGVPVPKLILPKSQPVYVSKKKKRRQSHRLDKRRYVSAESL